MVNYIQHVLCGGLFIKMVLILEQLMFVKQPELKLKV